MPVTLSRRAVLLSCLATAACGAAPGNPRAPVDPGEVARLEAAILGLGPDVDPTEAARAARVSYDRTRELAIQYQIEDGPIVHNTKVNMGVKPRGLCWHWAEDMEKALVAQNFQTLDIHRAIANWDNWRLEHSTSLISARGDGMMDAIVVDPWRKGGILTWTPARDDPDYEWWPQIEVLRRTGRLLNPDGTPVPRG